MNDFFVELNLVKKFSNKLWKGILYIFLFNRDPLQLNIYQNNIKHIYLVVLNFVRSNMPNLICSKTRTNLGNNRKNN